MSVRRLRGQASKGLPCPVATLNSAKSAAPHGGVGCSRRQRSLPLSTMPEAQKPLSDQSVEKLLAVAAEDARLRRHLLGLLIGHAFNLYSVVMIAGYIFIVLAAFNCLSLWQAVGAVCFTTPYFVMMLVGSHILKEFYVAKYANSAV